LRILTSVAEASCGINHEAAKLFGKRKTPVARPLLETVIVPRSAVERAANPGKEYVLVSAVVDFVNAMMSQGLYSRHEIPVKAVQAYHADYYLAQVNNGGHHQFIHNSTGTLKYAVPDIRGGLSAMNAEMHLAIFEEMAALLANFPDGRALLAAPESRSLGPLDTRFYGLEKTTPMSRLSSAWISGWPELRVMDDADARRAIQESAMLNPAREARMLSRSIERLTVQMTNRVHVGIGLACATATPPQIKVELGIGDSMEIEGRQQTGFFVRTSTMASATQALRFCVVSDSHAAAYECIQPDNPPMPKFGDVEGTLAAIRDGRMAQFKGPHAGKKLSHVEGETIAGVIQLATRYRAAAALDLLLRRAKIETEGAKAAPFSIAPDEGGMSVKWFVAAGRHLLFAVSGTDGSILWSPAEKRGLAQVSMDEIEDHAARANAGAIKLD
jgi:hypothetical protein